MSIDPALFRKTFASLASGVSIVTALHREEKIGITISSVTSVSLEPPLVLFCLDRHSAFNAAFGQGKYFAINILSEKQKDLAHGFASRTRRDWKLAPHKDGAHGLPLFDDALAHLVCCIEKRSRAGDHDIILAHIDSAHVAEGASPPLLHFRRHYHKLGTVKE